AKDSSAFQAPGCSRARTDWVMVCSSTLMAMAVIHSAKRGKPRRVKAHAKAFSRACQIDQVSVASVMMRLLCRGQLGLEPPGRFRPGDATFNRIHSFRCLCSYSGKLLNKGMPIYNQISLWVLEFGRRQPETRRFSVSWSGKGSARASIVKELSATHL